MDTKILQQIKNSLHLLSPEEAKEMLILMSEFDKLSVIDTARDSFLGYVRYIWPAFIEGEHHRIMANAFDRIMNGSLKRLIVNISPRHGKSEFASRLLPSYFLGHHPDKYVIQTSHTFELSADFGRQVRNLVDTPEYQKIFPGVELSSDSKSAGRWNTNKGGRYFAIGVGGAIAGRGAHLLIIDDPHSEQDAYGASKTSFDYVHDWFLTGPRQRLQPDAAIVVVMTRWHMRDLTGALVKDSIQKPGSDEWEVIELPAILPSGKPLWPEYWSLDLLSKLRAELPSGRWSAQYMQQPQAEGSAIIKREWWNKWTEEKPPKIKSLILSLDPAHTAKTKNDPSGCSVWGVFEVENDDGKLVDNIIVLDAWEEWLEFPDLKARMREEYNHWKPDIFLIEATASGLPLIQEFRAQGIPVREYVPRRGRGHGVGRDKIVRVNAVSDIFKSGLVWAPDRQWATKLIEQFGEFPNGEHDDMVDSSTMAIQCFRDGGIIILQSDEEFGEENRKPISRKYY